MSQDRIILDMISSVDLEKQRAMPVLAEWNLGVVLDDLSKPHYEPLQDASLKHITYKTVFLLAMALAGGCSEIQGLVLTPSTCSSSLMALELLSI